MPWNPSPWQTRIPSPKPLALWSAPERSDANWPDQLGSYRATVTAGPAFRLPRARGIGDTKDYRVAEMPPVNTGLLDGELAWRQHDGGQEDRCNMKHFITWANRLLNHEPSPEDSKN